MELNAYSPSDSEHWFKKYHFISDEDGLEDATSTQDGDGGETSHGRHDPKHGWINGQQVQMPEKSVVQNLFQSIDIGPRVVFPQVDVVTCFMIRRQLRRSLRPRAIHRIFYSFPQLERMVYEPWRAWSHWGTYTDSGEWQSLPPIPTYH